MVAEAFKIVGLCLVAAMGYGVVHDQITARICVEYFTVGHDNPFPTEDPTLLGLAWGIFATWWVGLILGVALVVAARVGPRPKRTAASLVRPVLRLVAVTAGCAFVAGVGGHVAAELGVIVLNRDLAARLPPSKHADFLACGASHLASYWVGFLGGGLQMAAIFVARKQAAR